MSNEHPEHSQINHTFAGGASNQGRVVPDDGSVDVWVITNIPTPYRIPFFNELNRQLSDRGLKLKVIFGARGYKRRQWAIDMGNCEFAYTVLDSSSFRLAGNESVSFTYPGLSRLIARETPRVIVTNAFSLATMKLWVRHFLHSTPYIIWSGDIHPRGGENLLRRLQRKLLVRGATRHVAYGTQAKNSLVRLGADPGKVHIAINTVDTRFYRQEVERIRAAAGRESHATLLCVGDLIPRKRVDLLLLALKGLTATHPEAHLDIVGDGPERARLEALARKLDLSQSVQFLGFRQKSEVAAYYAKANCFLFPTAFDIWGLVLVEAMAAGVPCISSLNAGATSDLIQEGKTGFSIDFTQTEAVAERLRWILDHPDEARKIGKTGQDFVETKVNLTVSARGMVEAIASCIGVPSSVPPVSP